MPSKVVNFYSTGDYDIDNLVGIYNHFIMFSKEALPVEELACALPLKWDEMVFPGFDSARYPGAKFGGLPKKWVITDYEKSSYYVDLQKIGGNDLDGYLGSLSPNTRSQIRRSIKSYEVWGKVNVTMAESQDEAAAMLEQLYSFIKIRKASKRIRPSINEFFQEFHGRLLQERFRHGEIQLLKIQAGKELIGYIYNHVYDGVVYFYQCGFNYLQDNKIRPGLVSHTAAIVMNKKLGYRLYDFGPGTDRYKRSLSNGSTTMNWVRLLRPSLKMKLFKWLKEMKEELRFASRHHKK